MAAPGEGLRPRAPGPGPLPTLWTTQPFQQPWEARPGEIYMANWLRGSPRASIERFCPTTLRSEVLRRYAQELAERSAAQEALAGASGIPRPPQPPPQPPQQAGQPSAAGSRDSPGTPASPPRVFGPREPVVGGGFVGEPKPPPSCCGRCLRKVLSYIKETIKEWVMELVNYVLLSTYMAFTSEKLFKDPEVEELYQRHHMQQWLPRLDWSLIAFLQMLAWDLVASPQFRISVVIYYYLGFWVSIFLHKSLFLAVRGQPWTWRWTRCALLCGFLLGRGAVCQPLLSTGIVGHSGGVGSGSLAAATAAATAEGYSSLRAAEDAQSASGLIGLGMTGLCSILALRVHTLDTLLLCITHGVACLTWRWMSGNAALDGTWHMLIGSHSMIACICVWQQHEQERLERMAFEQELLTERGKLLHLSDRIERSGQQADFELGMQLLFRARLVEDVTL